jgi:N-acetylneuraminate synthase
MELNNLPYLRELASFGVPLVLSTGMGTLEEIKQAVSVIMAEGHSGIILLHCTSIYPAPPEAIRLHNILGLRTEFPEIPIGYSDHSEGMEIACASVALGACLIEKHFTLDRTKIGMDNQMATEPSEMGLLVNGCLRVHQALGGAGRLITSREMEMAVKMRRSMIAKTDITAGTLLSEHLVEFKRPGTGIPPSKAAEYFGRVVRENISAGELISPAMII